MVNEKTLQTESGTSQETEDASSSMPDARFPVYLLSPTARPGVVHLPMIQFTLLPQTIDFSKYDGLILTSKQGVIALDEVSGGAWKSLPAAAIGKQTAAEIEKRGGRVLYTATKAYGDVLARELAERFDGMRWLYARPKVVVSKIAADLQKAGIRVDEVVVYETSCVRYDAADRPVEGAVIVFTAPSVARCFYENFGWDESWKAVAIGDKTAAAVDKFAKALLSPDTSLDKAVTFAENVALA
jgi:uroporphyrinogen-III synthase